MSTVSGSVQGVNYPPSYFPDAIASPSSYRSPTASVEIATCSDTHTCPGNGTGYYISFNILPGDVGNIVDAKGLTMIMNDPKTPLNYWWDHYVTNYRGVTAPPGYPCIQPGKSSTSDPDGSRSYATALAMALLYAFNVSPSRVCNAKLISYYTMDEITLESVKFVFVITDLHPKAPFANLSNDHLPSACLGPWITSWLSTSSAAISPKDAIYPPTLTIPAQFVSVNCPVSAPDDGSRLYFSGEVNVEENKNKILHNFMGDVKNSIQGISNKSYLNQIISPIEHATNISGGSIASLNAEHTSVYAVPTVLIQYYIMYAYPLSFIGAICFTIVQIMDINISSIVANKNVTMLINISFIAWSFVSLSVYYGAGLLDLTTWPVLGNILGLDLWPILPYRTDVVITQVD
jgi:hypothetical protein